jgi:hypothetical protein
MNNRWIILNTVHFEMKFVENCFGHSVLCIIIPVLVLYETWCLNNNKFKLHKPIAITS